MPESSDVANRHEPRMINNWVGVGEHPVTVTACSSSSSIMKSLEQGFRWKAYARKLSLKSFGALSEKNCQLVTDDAVEFEK